MAHHVRVTSSAFERLGGEPVLRAIIDDFVDRVTSDVMIGFFFARVDRARLTRLEYEHAAAHLGGDVVYSGRPLRSAHASHRIMGGHFARRREILRQTLVAHQAPDDVASEWLAHIDSLRGEITAGVVRESGPDTIESAASGGTPAEITPDVGSECAASARERE